jgi:hypothetical protein
LRLFFAHTWPPRQRRERTVRGRSPWAHWTPARRLVHPTIIGVSFWSPKKTCETSAGHAVSPKERAPRTAPRSPPPHIAFRQWPDNDAYPQSDDRGPTWDLVGQIFPPFSPGDPTTHPACPPWILVHPTEGSWSAKTPPQRFRRVRTLTPMPGRIVMPPEVSRLATSTPPLAGRPWLRTPPEGGFEQ